MTTFYRNADGVAIELDTTNTEEPNMTKSATVVTLDGKKHKKLPLTALASPGGAMMRPGVLPVAYWINGDGTGRTFRGITREHAFQRALRWGRDYPSVAQSERRPPRSPGGITPATPEDLSR